MHQEHCQTITEFFAQISDSSLATNRYMGEIIPKCTRLKRMLIMTLHSLPIKIANNLISSSWQFALILSPSQMLCFTAFRTFAYSWYALSKLIRLTLLLWIVKAYKDWLRISTVPRLKRLLLSCLIMSYISFCPILVFFFFFNFYYYYYYI